MRSSVTRPFDSRKPTQLLRGALLRRLAARAAIPILLTGIFTARAQTPASASFDSVVSAARQASEENRLADAVRLYRRALALRPRWTEGWWSLATLEYDQDRYAEAAAAFATLISLDRSNGTAHAMLGLCQFELGQDARALQNLLAAERLNIIKNEQLREVALYHLGILQLRARRFGDARATLDQLAKIGVRSRELIAALGLSALFIVPQDAPPAGTPGAAVVERAGQAEALLSLKDFGAAKQTYSRLAADFPDYPNLHFAFGRLLLEVNETDQAVEQFQLELKRDPDHVKSLLEIAATSYRVDSQEGLRFAQRALRLAPQIPFAHYLAGLLLLDTGDFAGAVPELEIARKSFPNDSRVYFSLGNAYSRLGRKADAAKVRAEFVRLESQEVQQQRATLYSDRPSGLGLEQMQTSGHERSQP
ncbi:MAG TPA: tetratricopeptide repeat protein [Bryobacteraceae bacterium]|nr:tetratricopeptide repeat protein [Bryobacteraceae bacterium]